jgi:uncharacterized protein YbjT (DUF2867 family)
MIVVTNPTGTVGHQVLENVLDSGEPIRVIARATLPPPLAHTRARRGVQESHGDIDVVNQAFPGADSRVLFSAPGPRVESVEAASVDFTRSVCDALQSQGVRRVRHLNSQSKGNS